ncbi:zinc ribbon domain-containing protein [Noviherbaspirillum sp.]|uniref:zinc ribbon domain-containing protein n=1 Tax=Noviherbaspirillum sp. TaxID=1926288 RepID=UPI002FE1B687
MSQFKFADNYQDLSQQDGVDAGFQFQFHCERCNDAWRTRYKPYRSGQASGWVSKAAGFFGGVLGGASSALDGLAQAGWNSARDEAFQEAVTDAKGHFHRCAKCFQYVCAPCTDKASGFCLNCAPDVEVQIAAARAQAESQGAMEAAVEEGLKRGRKRDVKRDVQLVCPGCNAETRGAKFCPECGHKMAVKSNCSGCSAEIAPGTRFCPECGKQQ